MKSALIVTGAAIVLFIGMMAFHAMTRHPERPPVRPGAQPVTVESKASTGATTTPAAPDAIEPPAPDRTIAGADRSAGPAELLAQGRYVDRVGQLDRRVGAIVDDLQAALNTSRAELAAMRSGDYSPEGLLETIHGLQGSNEKLLQRYARATEEFSGIQVEVNAIVPPQMFSQAHSVWLDALREFDTGLGYMKTGYERTNGSDIERGNEHLLRYVDLVKERTRLMKAVSKQTLGGRSD